MTEKTKDNKDRTAIIVAIITGIFVLIGACIGIAPKLIEILKPNTPTIIVVTPIPPAQGNGQGQPVGGNTAVGASTATHMPVTPTSPPELVAMVTDVPATATLVPPTPFPVDSNPPVSLPFTDNFDNGLRPEWRVVAGQPVAVDGYLAASKDTLGIEIGNNDLQNYSVSLDYKDNYNGTWLNGLTITIGQRVMFQAEGCPLWRAFQDGSWGDIIGCKRQISIPGKLRLTVNGNHYQVFANGALFSEITFGQPISGPMTLTLNHITMIDNLTITHP